MMLVHCRNWARHCSTETDDVHSTRMLFLTVHAAVMPTSVLPAPHGNTMMPERARLDADPRQLHGGAARQWPATPTREPCSGVAPVAKHLAQRLFLVRPDQRRGPQVNVQVRVAAVVVEVVLFQHRVLKLNAAPLDVLEPIASATSTPRSHREGRNKEQRVASPAAGAPRLSCRQSGTSTRAAARPRPPRRLRLHRRQRTADKSSYVLSRGLTP